MRQKKISRTEINTFFFFFAESSAIRGVMEGFEFEVGKVRYSLTL